MLAAPRAGGWRGVARVRTGFAPVPQSQCVLVTRATRPEKEDVPPLPRREHCDEDECQAPSAAPTTSTLSLPAILTLAATCAAAAFPTFSAIATSSPAEYDPTPGSEVLKNVAGAAYVVLIIIFAARLLRRRAATATSTRFASSPPPEVPVRRRAVARATPANAAWAAAQAGACAAALYAVCLGVDAFLEGRDLPDAYSARNIAVTLRTIGRGMAYLLTFIFGANAVGLTGERKTER